jgi:hypothetical protein
MHALGWFLICVAGVLAIGYLVLLFRKDWWV